MVPETSMIREPYRNSKEIDMSITSSNVISSLISYNKDRLVDLNKMLYVELQDGKYYDIIYLYAKDGKCILKINDEPIAEDKQEKLL